MCLARLRALACIGLLRSGRGGVGLALAMLLSQPVRAKALRVLAWPGYADSDLVKAFEQRLGVSVGATVIGPDDQLREKLAARCSAVWRRVRAGERPGWF